MDRGMNEYEAALFDAVLALGKTLLGAGVSETLLLKNLKEMQVSRESMGSASGAATIEQLITMLVEAPDHYIPLALNDGSN